MYGRIPKLCKHKGRNGVLRAYCTDPRTKREVYFGLWRTPEARAAYGKWLADYIASLDAPAFVADAPSTVNGLLSSYLEHAQERFRRVDGRTSSEYGLCLALARIIRALGLGDKAIPQFSRGDMVCVRDQITKRGLTRGHAHATMRRLVRFFRFGEERDWVTAEQVSRLERWPRLRHNEAPDFKEIPPAKVADLWKYYHAMPARWKDAMAIHCLLGCRTENALSINLKEIDQSVTPWLYRPRQQKSAWRGKTLTIHIGPRARAIIKRLESKAVDGYLHPGKGSSHLTLNGYAQAFRMVCAKYGFTKVIPRQVRHTAASYLLKRGVPVHVIGGVLGHAWTKSITGRYASTDARDIAAVVERYG